ncbi:MAG: class I SAM-dependent methyltransferase [Ignavibacteria bacterium]
MNILEKFTSDLVLKDGIYFSKEKSEISYPESGNESCFQIEQDSFWFNHRNKCILEAVKKYAPGELFFDIGGGNGFVAKALEENGIQTVLIEPGIKGCLNAKKRGLSNIVCSTLENASFKTDSIKAIGLFDVVEHIESDSAFLQSINNYLAKNGLVFITVPAFKFLWSNEDVEAGHYRRYTIKRLGKVLKESGFEIVYSTYIFSILPLPVFLRRTLPSKLGLNKNPAEINKYVNEHKTKKGALDKIMNKIWNYELRKIRNGKKIFTGGSCFAVARKV